MWDFPYTCFLEVCNVTLGKKVTRILWCILWHEIYHTIIDLPGGVIKVCIYFSLCRSAAFFKKLMTHVTTVWCISCYPMDNKSNKEWKFTGFCHNNLNAVLLRMKLKLLVCKCMVASNPISSLNALQQRELFWQDNSFGWIIISF
jgi:hypothetical protein